MNFIPRATQILERIRVMRIFNFAGMLEAIEETMQRLHHSALLTRRDCRSRVEKAADSEEFESGNSGQESVKANLHHDCLLDRRMLLLIDDIASAVAPQMSRNQVHGQPPRCLCMCSKG